jgi:hypothetical protein
MKKILIKLAIFFLPVALLAYGLDLMISSTLVRSNDYADGELPVWNALYNGKVNADIIIFGASNALRGLDTEVFEKRTGASTYSLAVNGLNFRIQYLRFRLLLAHNKKPKLIINAVSAATFEKTPELYNPDQFLPFLLYNKSLENVLKEYSDFKKADYNIPLIRYFGKKEAFIHILQLLINPSSNRARRINGYMPNDQEWTSDLEKAKAVAPTREFVLDNSLVTLFNKYVAECKDQNIGLVFVNMPEYIEGQSYVANRDVMLAPIYKSSSENQISFFNYLKDSISCDKKYFFNTGHLNKYGAEVFTNRLIDDMISAGIKEIKISD